MLKRLLPLLLFALTSAAQSPDLAGLWTAKRWFGPEARGTLIVRRAGNEYTADFMGRVMPVRVERGAVAFELPNGEGRFRGTLAGGVIAGRWYQPHTVTSVMEYVSPVELKPEAPNRWSGVVAPFDETFTFHLHLQPRPDGSMTAILSNPERDYGGWLGVERLVRDANVVKLLGRRRGQKEERELVTGTYDAAVDRIALSFPTRGGIYEFRRAAAGSAFYPRGAQPDRYAYRPPPARADGWAVGTLEEAGIDRAAIETLIRTMVDTPMQSADTPEVHALLIARGGKLVLEEYFHGEHREKLHDTRSASKSIVALIAGAAMQAGAPLSPSTRVYEVMNGSAPDPDPRKRAMTLEHLLTMSSGYDCDDWSSDARVNEDTMNEQEEEPDYYRYTLNVPMAREPGQQAVYCSLNSNLALGVIGRVTGEYPLELFDRLIGRPMKIARYAWQVNRVDQPYGGGGVQMTARDFLKLGQLLLSGGTWAGKRILSSEFATRATSPLYSLGTRTQYGYLWWTIDYPYRGRTVRAFYAGGTGGQAVVMIPELDLGIATFGANYSSAGTYHVQLKIIPDSILPAVSPVSRKPRAAK